MFTDTEFMSAKEKELVLKQWRTFLKKILACDFNKQSGSDYGYFLTDLDKSFTDRLYKHLSLHCGFIAHYNRYGFLAARFGSAAAIAETIQQLNTGIPYPGFADLNRAMVAELAGIYNKLLAKAGQL